MDIYGAATYFDGIPVTDTANSTLLFTGQLDLYDAAVKDSLAGWRRTVSAAAVTLPSDGVVTINSRNYLAGRVIDDVFLSQTIRQHLLLHPCDTGSFSMGTALAFLSTPQTSVSFYGASELRKELKEEGTSSQFFNVYNIFMSKTETPVRDYIIKGPDNRYYRVENVEEQSGGLRDVVANDLGTSVFTTLTYNAQGAYTSSTDTYATTTTNSVKCFVERYQDNYRYLSQAAAKYQNGDKVVTILPAVIPTPKAGDTLTPSGMGTFNVIGSQSDGLGAWELHVRPV